MAIIKCKMCGGEIELSTDRTFGTCDYCGSTMTFPKVDNEQRAAAFNRGNHFRRIGEFDKALAVYERIVREDDTDAEAHWCCALCRFGIEYVEDPATYEYLPTCHRASFDSFLEDVDYLAAVEHSDGLTRRQYQKDAAKIAEVQRGILSTSQNTEPFDVFICYKESDENGNRTRDSLLAQDIYYQLTEQGWKVFFARITLEDVVGKQYEPYIFAALNSAKVMVVVGTKAEHLNAVWVKNEWSRFLSMMKKDHHKLLLPCYRDMDPYNMPEQLAVLQSYDMAKIGFIQDLTRGIAKVLDAERKPAAQKETVVVQHASGSNASVLSLIKRGNMALEDQEWANADAYFERALDIDAENSEAFLGKFLAANKHATLVNLLEAQLAASQTHATLPVVAGEQDTQRINLAVEKYYVPTILTKNEIRKKFSYNLIYDAHAPEQQRRKKEALKWLDSARLLARARQFASGTFKDELESSINHFLKALDNDVIFTQKIDSDAIAATMNKYNDFITQTESTLSSTHEQALTKLYNKYVYLCNQVSQITTSKAGNVLRDRDINQLRKLNRDFDALSKNFEALEGYLDSAERAVYCTNLANNMKFAELVERKKKAILPSDFFLLEREFDALGNHPQAAEYARECHTLAQHLKEGHARQFISMKTAKSQRIAELEAEERRLDAELLNLTGLFTGSRRRKIEASLQEISSELEFLKRGD